MTHKRRQGRCCGAAWLLASAAAVVAPAVAHAAGPATANRRPAAGTAAPAQPGTISGTGLRQSGRGAAAGTATVGGAARPRGGTIGGAPFGPRR